MLVQKYLATKLRPVAMLPYKEVQFKINTARLMHILPMTEVLQKQMYSKAVINQQLQ